MKKHLVVLSMLSVALMQSAAHADSSQGVSVGTGSAKFNGLVQGWAVNDTTATDAHFNYRLRRAELKLSGSVIEDARWFVMVDPAKGASLMQDAGIAYTLMSDLEFSIGQFKTPTSAEGLMSSGELMFPERSYSGRYFGDHRELGAMLTYKTAMYKASVMSSNGFDKAAGGVDVDDKKDIAVRLDLMPMDELTVGAFTVLGNGGYSKGRWGANFNYVRNQWSLMAEGAKEHGVAGGTKYGYVVAAGYEVNKNWTPVVRWQEFIKNDGFDSFSWEIGVNYMMLKHNSKIQASYANLHNFGGSAGTPVPTDMSNGSQFTLAFQTQI